MLTMHFCNSTTQIQFVLCAMSHLSYGPVTKHVHASTGANCNPKYFYVTEYSTSHGRESFLPRVGQHIGTGYKSNFRPGLYYSRKLDEVDNPHLGTMLSSNYTSSHQNQFKLNHGSIGKDILPKHVRTKKSGFVRDVPKTLATSSTVKKAVYNPDLHDESKYRTLLYKTNNKDPVENENNMNGPIDLSTENKTRYLGKPSEKMDTSSKTVGTKEGSGFTHAHNIEPITYRPNESFHGRYPGIFTNRPTFNSVMKTSFQVTESSQHNTETKLLSKRAERNTGYTREIKSVPAYAVHPDEAFTRLEDVPKSRQLFYKKNDPAEYYNLKHAKPYQTITSSVFERAQTSEPSGKGQRCITGKKEDTGYTENNCTFVVNAETPALLDRFNTHYNLRFYDKNPVQFSQPCKQKVLNQAANGFTKSTCVQSFGDSLDRSQQLLAMHPYVARSVRLRDPYFIETNVSKKRESII